MQRFGVFCSLVLLFNSCYKQEKLNVNEITLTACNYIDNEETSVPEFYVASHIRIDSSGTCRIAKRTEFKKELHYYTASLPDTLLKLINSMVFFQSDTTFKPEFTGMYCGFSYFLTVREKVDNRRHLARFIPPNLNGDYIDLYDHLKRFCDTISYNKISRFNFDKIESLIRKDLMDTTYHKFPIKIKKLENIQFLSPKK